MNVATGECRAEVIAILAAALAKIARGGPVSEATVHRAAARKNLLVSGATGLELSRETRLSVAG
ncbi:MAG: hypothetical protein IPM13_10525 [Phycisphaerales bacterium]|nr:hypothetical protein [Phycisphaerales bacterium]